MQVLKSIVLSAVMVCFIAIAANAQEPPPFAKDVSQGQSQNEGITTGCVIAYGAILDPPYFVVYNDGVVTINDIPFIPKKKDPNKKTPKFKLSENSVRTHNFIREFERNYKKYYKLYGTQKANEMIYDEFKDHELIDSLEVKSDLAIVKFKDGNEEYLFLYNKSSEYYEEHPVTEQKREEQIRDYADRIIPLLKDGWLITFGYEYDSYFTVSKSKEIMDAINKMKSGEIDVQTGKDQINEITGGVKNLTKDIIDNL